MLKLTGRRANLKFLFAAALLALAPSARAEIKGDLETVEFKPQKFNLHFQSTAVTQQHGGFTSPYSGPNSLSSTFDSKTSVSMTLFFGAKLWHGAEFYLDPELAGGSGFDKTEGMAAFPNGEIYRIDDAGAKWNLARAFVKQVFGLSENTEAVDDDKNQLASRQAVERVTVVVGRFSLNDYFDQNAYSHDPRTQFLNWALMDNGAWDYAADTRGYTWGAYFEYARKNWSIRWAEVLEPVSANQIELDTNIGKSHGDNIEIEKRYKLADRPGAARLLIYHNQADMGSYRATLSTPADNEDVTLTRAIRDKYGIGLSADQALTDDVGVFGRLGWNDGRTETWAFTEIDQSFSVGASLKGSRWDRANDNVGAALIISGLSADHRAYLAAGGHGFIIGDGKLNYAPECVLEMYYLLEMTKGLAVTGDVQLVADPAYNRDRGPLSIFSARVHYEL